MVIDADALVAAACEATGLDDLGADDFRDGLGVYCSAVETEAQLNEVGAMAVPGTVVASLSNRLRVVDFARRHSEVADEQIEAPLVVVGMFRAGTTFLSQLLEHDPANRPLLRWEAGDSVPPPTLADFRAGPRVDAARAAGDMLEQLNPKMRAIHHEEADGPTECISVMSQDFKSLSWEAITNVPSYGRWLLATDQRSAYEYHRLVLQTLQSAGVRGRWTLKSPHHAIALDALVHVYPDAELVVLHRDPVELCASVCSLITELSSCFTDADHRAYITTKWVDLLDESVRRLDRFRAARPDIAVHDVHYDAFVAAPVSTVESIYAAFGHELAPDARCAMQAYVDAHPKDGLGVHRYTAEDYGLSPAEIRERFAPYAERYGVATH